MGTASHVLAIGGLGIQALAARAGLDGGSQGPLPPRQWQTEVQNWHYTGMAALQKSFIDGQSGPRTKGEAELFQYAPTPDHAEMCKGQVSLSFPD